MGKMVIIMKRFENTYCNPIVLPSYPLLPVLHHGRYDKEDIWQRKGKTFLSEADIMAEAGITDGDVDLLYLDVHHPDDRFVAENDVRATADPSAFYYDGVYEIRDGKEVDLTQEQYAITKSTQEFYEISSINPNYTYIGSVLQANSIDIGQYRPVAYPSVLKPEVTISFSLPIRSKTIAPTRSSFNNAIVEAIGDKDFSGKQSQVFSYKMKEFDYYKEVNMAFGANVNIGQLFGSSGISRDAAIMQCI